MNRLFSILLISAICLGLTPAERKLATTARDKAKAAQAEYDKSRQSAIDGWDYASRADQHAFETDQKIVPLKEQIQASHDNEVALKGKVDKYEPFYIESHKLWGIKGIIICFGILAAHVLVLIGAIIALALILWVISLTRWGAILEIPVQIVGRFLRSIRDKILKKKS